jgi:hypothetical protein
MVHKCVTRTCSVRLRTATAGDGKSWLSVALCDGQTTIPVGGLPLEIKPPMV